MSILYYWALVKRQLTIRSLKTFNLYKREVWFSAQQERENEKVGVKEGTISQKDDKVKALAAK
jgi:hypothetical protein